MLVAATAFLPDRAAAGLPPRFGGALKIAIPARIQTWNPAATLDPYELTVLEAVYEPLMRFENGKYRPVLLEELPRSEADPDGKGRTLSFKLKEDVHFHSGNKLTSRDALFTLMAASARKVNSRAWMLDAVTGLSDFQKGARRDVSGFKVLDETSFSIHLGREAPEFLKALSLPCMAVISSRNPNPSRPDGTGPFYFDREDANGKAILKANLNHRDGRPYLDEAHFVVMENERDMQNEFLLGRLDAFPVLFGRPSDETFKEGEVTEDARRRLLAHLDVNPAQKPFDDPKAPARLGGGIDRVMLARINGWGHPVGKSKSDVKYDLKGKADGAQYEMWIPKGGEAARLVAEKLTGDFGKLGVRTVVVEKDKLGMTPRKASDAPAFRLLVYLSDPALGEGEINKTLARKDNPSSGMAARWGAVTDPGKAAAFRIPLFDSPLAWMVKFRARNFDPSKSAGGLENVNLLPFDP